MRIKKVLRKVKIFLGFISFNQAVTRVVVRYSKISLSKLKKALLFVGLFNNC